jgi:apolipoprotein D and lipocalin family protein
MENSGDPRNPKRHAHKIRRTCVVLLLGSIALLAAADNSARTNTASTPGPLATIASLDVPRYAGVWFEIAKYPNWFQRMCASNTKAEYSPQPNGTVRVVNRCTTDDGKTKEALGVARQIGAASSPKLEVQFTPAWLSFIPFLWADYWVIDLDPDYQLVAVSEPKREYLWVLSRTPEITAAAYDALLARLETKGFDLQKLARTRQGN